MYGGEIKVISGNFVFDFICPDKHEEIHKGEFDKLRGEFDRNCGLEFNEEDRDKLIEEFTQTLITFYPLRR